MGKRLQILLISLICVCLGQADNVTTPAIPLSFYRLSGLYDAMANSSSLLAYMKRRYPMSGKDREPLLNLGSNSKIKRLGTTSITGIERSELDTSLKHAGCDLYDQVVPIPNDRSNVIMFPSCVLIKQCGGCCIHPSLACKPTETVPKTVQVMKLVYDGRSVHPVREVEYLQMEEHTNCQCQCKTTAEDCNSDLHTFDNFDCKCQCKRTRTACPNNKRWSEDICACTCATTQNCGTGYTFDIDTCSCLENSERGGGGVIPGSSNSGNIEEVEPPPREQCGNSLRCPRGYKPTLMSGGHCKCKFSPRRRG